MFIDDLAEVLLKGNHTIVIYKSDSSLVVSDERGVAPLMRLLSEDKAQLKGSLIADKVIGKAAALLMIHGGVKEVYTPTISLPAIEIFNIHNIKIHYDKLVERIVNRKGDGLCPMESLCLETDNPEDAFKMISEKLSRQSHQAVVDSALH